jgi:orotidine-5'-phosphate decarboxylase
MRGTRSMPSPDNRLIVALDLPGRHEAEALVDRLGGSVGFYKIGYQLAYGGDGLAFGRELIAAGKKVFFDLKLLDIGHVVGRGVEAIAKTGATMLTVHAYPQAMAAAVSAAQGSGLTLLGVTVLTSFDDADLRAAHYRLTTGELVRERAAEARDAGMGGIVCSPHEAAAARAIIGAHMAIVTPGVRPTGSAINDQKRIATPQEALGAGASHLVVGRAITAAADPAAAALAVQAEMQRVAQPAA